MSCERRIALGTLVMVALVGSAQAQTLAIGATVGKPPELVAKAPAALRAALERRGATVVTRHAYLAAAAEAGLSEENAFSSASMRKLAPELELDALIVVRVGRERVRLALLGPKGGLIDQYKLDHGGEIRAATFAEQAAAIVEKLGGKTAEPASADQPTTPAGSSDGEDAASGDTMQLRADDLEMEPQSDEEAAAAAAEKLTALVKPGKATVIEASPPDDGAADRSGSAGDGTVGDRTTAVTAENGAGADGEGIESAEGELAAGAQPAGPPAPPGAVPDVMAAAGPSMHFRAGLSPLHESGAFPGLHIVAHAYLASVLRMDWVEDIGLGFGFDTGLGLDYAAPGDGGHDAQQYAWSVDLLYRLALLDDVILKPTFLVRLGIGSTTATIDSSRPGLHDASYLYPHGTIEIVLAVWDPYLTAHAEAGYLFAVFASEDLSGVGSGFQVGGGVDGKLFEAIIIGVGYEMRQFLGMKGTGNLGTEQTMADVHNRLYLRVGWVFQ